jgi:hypothetical protein
MGDQCAHGGAITLGCPTVMIGETGSGSLGRLSAMPIPVLEGISKKMPPEKARTLSQIIALKSAAEDGTPFCEVCGK